MITVKKKCYQLALIHHPDRVGKNKKSKANNEFHIIHQAYSILSDPKKKRAYDDGLDKVMSKATISAKWESHLRAVDTKDFDQAKNEYQGSKQEEEDIIRETCRGKGSITHLLHTIPFMIVENESRILELIQKMMANGRLPQTKIKKLPKNH